LPDFDRRLHLSWITYNLTVPVVGECSGEKNLATNSEVMQCSAVDRQSERAISQFQSIARSTMPAIPRPARHKIQQGAM
jgi:hypothetical protein